MKVAFTVYIKDSLGGAERRLIRIYNELCKTNSVSCELLVRGCDEEKATDVFERADCSTNNISKVICFERTKECLKHILETQYDIIHYFEGNRFNSIIEFISRIKGIKTIYTLCNYYEALNIADVSKMRYVRRQLKMADIVDLLYPLGLDYISKIRKRRIDITPGTFTELMLFKPQKKERLMVYAAARLEKGKNPELLIEACECCKESIRDSNYKVIVLGKGELFDRLAEKVNTYGIDDIVELSGYKKTSEYLPYAEVAFSLQMIENYPSQMVAEAASSGCFLIITDVGDSRKCADTSFCQFIHEDKYELAEAIVRYIDLSENEKSRIIADARNYASVNYSLQRSVEYFRGLLETLC